MRSPAHISVGRGHGRDPNQTVHMAMAGIDPGACRFILAFVPATLEIDAVVSALKAEAGGTPVFGCTTAGQITADGYEQDALLLLGFPTEHFRCASMLFETLRPFSAARVADSAQRLMGQFRRTAGWSRLGLIFCDGVSNQEDVLISTLETVLDSLPIFGGSAGDGLRFEETFVLQDGVAHRNAALLLLIETDLRFQGLGIDHFLPVGGQFVITAADPDERLVYEINGSPAALEYARLVGCPVEALSPMVFAENPLLLNHAGQHYVRAISDVAEGHALSFMAAIDDGLIMSLGAGQEIIKTLRHGLEVTDETGCEPDFILGFDCVLRKLEIEQKQLAGQVSEILVDRRVLGFNTYGEQQAGIHMNQTFVGVAFFEPSAQVAM